MEIGNNKTFNTSCHTLKRDQRNLKRKDFNSFLKLEYEEFFFVAFDYGWNENLNIEKVIMGLQSAYIILLRWMDLESFLFQVDQNEIKEETENSSMRNTNLTSDKQLSKHPLIVTFPYCWSIMGYVVLYMRKL